MDSDGRIRITKHARMRWHERRSYPTGWSALSDVEELAEMAWDYGKDRTFKSERYRGVIVKHFSGCEFVFSDSLPTTLITFYPLGVLPRKIRTHRPRDGKERSDPWK